MPSRVQSKIYGKEKSSNVKGGDCAEQERWICIMCRKQFSTSATLTFHHISHTMLEVSGALTNLQCLYKQGKQNSPFDYTSQNDEFLEDEPTNLGSNSPSHNYQETVLDEIECFLQTSAASLLPNPHITEALPTRKKLGTKSDFKILQVYAVYLHKYTK